MEACPDFSVKYRVLLGTCSSETTVIAMLANGSALPPFASYRYASGALEIVGTVPLGTEPFQVVAVALLGEESFTSIPSTITLVESKAIQVLAPPASSSIRACPVVQIAFKVIRRSNCGNLLISAAMLNGSALPKFLSTATSGNSDADGITFTVFGTVPEDFPDFAIVASASTGGAIFSSSPVHVTRPKLVSSVNVTMQLTGGAVLTTGFMSTPQILRAPYGATVESSVMLETGSLAYCDSIGLVVSDTPPPRFVGSSDLVPRWISVTLLSTVGAIVRATPPSDIAPGTSVVLYVWANDGRRYSGFNLTIVTAISLLLIQSDHPTSPNSSAYLQHVPAVATPAPLLQMQISFLGIVTGPAPVLICPYLTSSAFCSFSTETMSLGAFGTPSGVNAVLQGLSVSLPTSSASVTVSLVNNVTLLVTFKESVNPIELSVRVPLSVVKSHSGVTLVRPLNFSAIVGRPITIPLDEYFQAEDLSSASFAVTMGSNATSWLVIEGGFVRGMPPAPSQMSHFSISAADKFTKNVVQGVVNVSWPDSPVATPPMLSHWVATTSSQLDVRLPEGVIVDPQNGTITFSLLQYVGLQDLRSLPAFLTFDANSLRMSGTPHSGDLGHYVLVLIGTSRWGSWNGNASVLLTITVEQSWGDFFAWVYSIVGYIGTALAVITWCLVYRALLINMAVFHRRVRRVPPPSFLRSGRYELQLPADQIRAVNVIRIEKPSAPVGMFQSSFLAMRSRLLRSPLFFEISATGVAWAGVVSSRRRTLELMVDVELVRRLVATGDLKTADEYFVMVTSNAWWVRGTVVEAFAFRINELLVSALYPSQMAKKSPRELAAELASLKLRLRMADNKIAASLKEREELSLVLDDLAMELEEFIFFLASRENEKMLARRGKMATLDPYTGQAVRLPKSDMSSATSSTTSSWDMIDLLEHH